MSSTRTARPMIPLEIETREAKPKPGPDEFRYSKAFARKFWTKVMEGIEEIERQDSTLPRAARPAQVRCDEIQKETQKEGNEDNVIGEASEVNRSRSLEAAMPTPPAGCTTPRDRPALIAE